MKHQMPLELDPEFDVLPDGDQRYATNLRFWHDTKIASVTKYRRIRNGLGIATVLAGGGQLLEQFTEGVGAEGYARSVAIGGGIGLMIAGTLRAHYKAIEESAIATRCADEVGELFQKSNLEAPQWVANHQDES